MGKSTGVVGVWLEGRRHATDVDPRYAQGHDNVGWALARLAPQVGRSFGTPTPYIVLAPLFSVEGWIASALATRTNASLGTRIGAIGGGAMLALAAGAWLLRRLWR